MSRRHPKNTTLAEFAAGTLNEGRSLVIAAHLAMCGSCRGFVSALTQAGGQMLDEIEPAAMAKDAAAQALSLLDRDIATEAAARPSAPDLARWTETNELLGYRLGPWRKVWPGLQYRNVEVQTAGDSRVFMLKAAPGLKLPAHRHTGTELTCVFSGAFIHEGGRYGAGDCDDADENDVHSPVVDDGEECVCLVAMQGQIRLNSFIGRLIQPLIRI